LLSAQVDNGHDGLQPRAKAKLAEAYRKRLREVAGFQCVPEPMPMRNRTGNTIYYLFFASPNATGKKIVEAILNKYRNRGPA